MATSTQNRNATPTVSAVIDRATEAQEQFTTAARKAGNAYLDTYEKAVDRAIDLELRFAESTRQDWIKSVAEAQTGFARELTETYASTARTLLK
jgi:hypothetical protein